MSILQFHCFFSLFCLIVARRQTEQTRSYRACFGVLVWNAVWAPRLLQISRFLCLVGATTLDVDNSHRRSSKICAKNKSAPVTQLKNTWGASPTPTKRTFPKGGALAQERPTSTWYPTLSLVLTRFTTKRWSGTRGFLTTSWTSPSSTGLFCTRRWAWAAPAVFSPNNSLGSSLLQRCRTTTRIHATAAGTATAKRRLLVRYYGTNATQKGGTAGGARRSAGDIPLCITAKKEAVLRCEIIVNKCVKSSVKSRFTACFRSCDVNVPLLESNHPFLCFNLNGVKINGHQKVPNCKTSGYIFETSATFPHFSGINHCTHNAHMMNQCFFLLQHI